ncbi:MAG: HU family DNA-binding protein [Planctomycetaceae bacterium]|jgi:predicted histone-like DNA-binding protein|nr:HU family DNA-binding protein [Planctomycetaceae bacterium]
MAIKLKKIQKKNPQQLNISKWYFTQEKTGSVGINEIAKEIEGRSALSFGDVQSTLSNLVDMMPLFLKMGQTIKLEGFGSFHITVSSEGTDTAEELNTRHVKGVKLIFVPSTELKRSLEDISFEIE